MNRHSFHCVVISIFALWALTGFAGAQNAQATFGVFHLADETPAAVGIRAQEAPPQTEPIPAEKDDPLDDHLSSATTDRGGVPSESAILSWSNVHSPEEFTKIVRSDVTQTVKKSSATLASAPPVLLTTTTMVTLFTTVTVHSMVTTQTFGPLPAPQAFVEKMMGDLMGVMQSPDYAKPERQPWLRETVREELLQAADMEVIGALALANYQKSLTIMQRREFVERLSRLYFSGFIVLIEQNRASRFVVTDSLRPNATRARVGGKFVFPAGDVTIGFRLLARPDRWVLYDVHISKVSLQRSFRNEMRQILHDRDFANLIERMDIAIARDPIASSADRLSAEIVAATNHPQTVPVSQSPLLPQPPVPPGARQVYSHIQSDLEATSIPLVSKITTTTQWNVLTTMTLSTIYTTRSQRVVHTLVTESNIPVTTPTAATSPKTTEALPNEPEAVVRVTVGKVIDILKRSDYAAHREKNREAIRNAILPAVAMDLVGRLTLSQYQANFTDKEFELFKLEFSNLLFNSYIMHMEKYTDEEFIVLPARDVAEGKARVATKTVSPKKEIPIDFSMAQVNGQWLIYDLRIEGVSLVSNFRKQFQNILMRNPPAVLIQRIQDKVKENAAE